MNNLEEKLLAKVTVNYLFLGQFETFRASLQNLKRKNPDIAVAILQAIVENGGKLEGIEWSRSVNSPSHLAWLALGELLGFGIDFKRGRESVLWGLDPDKLKLKIEFLILLQEISKIVAAKAETVVKNTERSLWQLGASSLQGYPEATSSVDTKGGEEGHSGGPTGQVGSEYNEGGTSQGGQEVSPVGDEVISGKVSEQSIGENVDWMENEGVQFFKQISDVLLERLRTDIKNGVREATAQAREDTKGEEQASRDSNTPGVAGGRDAGVFDSKKQECEEEVLGTLNGISKKERELLRKVALYQPQLLDALCWNITRQKVTSRNSGSKSAETVSRCNQNFFVEPSREASLESIRSDRAESSQSEAEILCDSSVNVSGEQTSGSLHEWGSFVQKEVQMAHLNAVAETNSQAAILGSLHHLRFLCEKFGMPESIYSEVINKLVRKIAFPNDALSSQEVSQPLMMKMYEQLIASGSTFLLSLVESVQDRFVREEAETYRASSEQIFPPPLHRLHKSLQSLRIAGAKSLHGGTLTENLAVSRCVGELYQYSRASGAHMLESVMDAALSSIKRCHLQTAVDVLTPFPCLQPLVAVMGWDLLAGNTSARQKMMQLLRSSKSMESSAYRKHTDEICCIDHLCDQLCYRLELAYFAAYINSGLEWDNSYRLFLFDKGSRISRDREDGEPADPFVANLVLERLAMHSPVRVLFDVVPDIKLQYALELVKMQPAASSMAKFQRMEDLELLHLHYGVQAAVLALASMEQTAEDSENSKYAKAAADFLHELQEHLDAVSNPARRLWLMSITVALLHMDGISMQMQSNMLEEKIKPQLDDPEGTRAVDGGQRQTAVGFVGRILGILRQCMPPPGFDFEDKTPRSVSFRGSLAHDGALGRMAVEAWEWRASFLRRFVDDWEWRLAVLQRLSPSPQRQWKWKEAFTVLRAAPSTLLNMCVQKAQYDLGEEAVHRFALPPEDEAALQLAEWVDGVFARASVDDAVSRVVEGTSSADEALKLVAFRAPLAPLASVLLCVDVAAASARSTDMSRQLLNQARSLLTEISPGSIHRQGSSQSEQIQEACIILVAKRVLQCLQELLEQACQDKRRTLQGLLSGAEMINVGFDNVRQGPRQRALAILQQTIEDAHNGKRQFLSGKLHNLVKALVDEETDDGSMRLSNPYSDRKAVSVYDSGFLLSCGFRVLSKTLPQVSMPLAGDHSGENTFFPLKGTGKRFLGPLSAKPSAYLSAFILYVATIGDIVDGVDTTHDFNFFSLVHERPNDLLTRLVFERGSADAAGRIAEIMGADLVHQVISACVPPVYPPMSARGWACMPQIPPRPSHLSESQYDANVPSSSTMEHKAELYPLRLDVVKHLATLSPVRAILSCVFGASSLNQMTKDGEVTSASRSSSAVLQMDTYRSFYEFTLDQSDRFPTLNRWIQMQANLQRLSDFPATSKRMNDSDPLKDTNRAILLKRSREPESDTESEEDEEKPMLLGFQSSRHQWEAETSKRPSAETILAGLSESRNLLFDWENEGPYEETVQRLMEEGKLVDALALADRYLRGGAPDHLLQLLIEKGNDGAGLMPGQWQGFSGQHNLWNITWQYCLRLHDKRLAATLALKFLKNWDLDAAIDVLTMCSCHLLQNDPLHAEVLQVKQALQQYSRILRADGRFSNWQEVESLCQKDPEELALRLAGRGAVSAALEVAETFGLRDELRRELQGRQLVKLLTSDPVNGGGPAEALRFLCSLHLPQDALPVAMAAMEQLPSLQSKQLLVHFFLKRRIGMLSDEELVRLHKLALGLQMLGALPLPWQQRCSALHQHPNLILETLLMWKQLEAASQLLKAFPSLRDDNLILVYAAKAINVSSHSHYERRSSLPSMAGKSSSRLVLPAKGSYNSGITKEARRAFSWTSRDSGNKIVPKEISRKRKNSALPPSQKAAWEAMSGIHEERLHSLPQDGYERLAPVTMTEGCVLTGEPVKDDAVRASHRYESAPCITLFKALLALCSSEAVAAKAAVELCINQMQCVLSPQQLPLHASSETVERAFHAIETFVQALLHAKTQLRKLSQTTEPHSTGDESKEHEDGMLDAGSLGTSSEISTSGVQSLEEFSDLLSQADVWLNHAELLQSLLGSGIVATLDDVADKESAERLRDRLIEGERYSMAVYACTKCKIDAFPVWKTWAHALVQMEHYAQARVKLKQALRLHKGDAAPIIRDLILTMEEGPQVDVPSVRSLYVHMAKSASTISDDSLSADAYLNVLYMPSAFTKSERSRRSSEDTADSFAAFSAQTNGDDGPRSNLDNVRYEECVYYLQEYARQDLLSFMFRHGRYADACLLFFPPKSIPPYPVPSSFPSQTPTSSPQRPDTLATDYGSIDDLCELCVAYGAMPVLERVIATRGLSSTNQDPLVSQHTAAALARICTYCENHKHFNHLYRFQVLKKDHVAAGLCCIQLFLNASYQDQALRHLERAKMHFDEGLSARQQAGEVSKSTTKAARSKSPSERFTEEELIKFSTRISIQMDVVRCFSDSECFPWRHSLFGNPNDADTVKRRSEVVEALSERNFDLAFQIIYEFGLPAVHIYAAVAASLADRKKSNQIAELLKNIKATISDDDLDQVIGAAIMVFANKHRERPDRLIEMLSSSHRKVLACVACGRLKTAFQIASRSANAADVQYVAHEARQSGALPVEDMCKQWLARNL